MFYFSYKVVSGGADHCIIPNDAVGTLKFTDLSVTASDDFVTYFVFTPHLDNSSALGES